MPRLQSRRESGKKGSWSKRGLSNNRPLREIEVINYI
jgi:hypothetical protein